MGWSTCVDILIVPNAFASGGAPEKGTYSMSSGVPDRLSIENGVLISKAGL